MSATVTAITEWIRTLGSDADTAAVESTADAGAAAQDGPGSSLFECAECQLVYVAAEKTTCARCGTPVEQVASTLPVSE